jgi:hypothetical protein
MSLPAPALPTLVAGRFRKVSGKSDINLLGVPPDLRTSVVAITPGTRGLAG